MSAQAVGCPKWGHATAVKQAVSRNARGLSDCAATSAARGRMRPRANPPSNTHDTQRVLRYPVRFLTRSSPSRSPHPTHQLNTKHNTSSGRRHPATTPPDGLKLAGTCVLSMRYSRHIEGHKNLKIHNSTKSTKASKSTIVDFDRRPGFRVVRCRPRATARVGSSVGRAVPF